MPRPWLVLAVWLLCAPVGAQTDTGHQAFDTIRLAGGVSLPLGDSYDGRWAVRPGAWAHASTEFVRGRAHLAVQVYDNDNGTETTPDFLAVQGEVGWGYPVHLPAGISATGGGHLGAIRFRFRENEQFSGFVQDETEVTAGLFARAEAPVGGRLGGFAEVHWIRVFTAEPISLTRVQVGLSLTFDSPAWARRFLR
ncbi:MAG: hypothetical protein HKN04_01030 [Rhodothermaceae bacterium]|nr:hypothetical protein [Rhodothermaceae bacterium]